MKNSKLKGLLIQKMAGTAETAHEVTILNKEELLHAMGGATSDCDCGMLQSCGTYCKCGLKVRLELE